VVELVARSALSAHGLPMEIGGLRIDEVAMGPVWAVMPFAGQAEALSAVFEEALGLTLPDPGYVQSSPEAEILWTGQEQWFFCGVPVVDVQGHGSVTEQSDGWAVLSVRGDAVRDVMARLCPLDLRDFRPGQVARSEFAHMMSIILPRAGGYDVWVMRSFGATALHHLRAAALGVAG